MTEPGTSTAAVQATNVHYDLHSLGWKSFQDLCATIVRDIWGQTFQVFSDTNDGGRDGAYCGTWVTAGKATFEGTFAVQCKFTVDREKSIGVRDLKEEVVKAASLAKKGLANNYVLFTNAKLTGRNDERIREVFSAVHGIKRVVIYGHEAISSFIRESAKLRSLVPRLYGLGDLSQILDERGYAQADAILGQLGDGLRTFVITEAYRNSAKAVSEHGFVLLLGEPACGKSTIAGMLAVGAIDLLKCRTMKICTAEDFRAHWNPNDPRQLFWVDDAFGVTQFEWDRAAGWSRSFGHVQAAINLGAKFIFTSRDYIFRSAKRVLKTSALPVLNESQVVIQVEKITQDEREKILYNHIKLGKQPSSYKSAIKPFLPGVASHARFSPESARRLGNPFFTKGLNVSVYGLGVFVDNPVAQLLEVIRTIDDNSRSALALLFINGGVLSCPLRLSTNDMQAIVVMGGDQAGVAKALDALEGDLLIKSRDEFGDYAWRYKHPTIGEAFSIEVSENAAFLDIYLAGAKLTNIFREVSCGDLGIEGVKLVVPRSRNAEVIVRLHNFDKRDWSERMATAHFLANRCDLAFFQDLLAANARFPDSLQLTSYLRYCYEADVVARMRQLGILDEARRLKYVELIQSLAVQTPDAGFLTTRFREILTEAEVRETLAKIESEVIPNLSGIIDDQRSGHDGEEDPADFFDDLKTTLKNFRDEFGESSETGLALADGLEMIDTAISDLREEMDQRSSAHDEEGDLDIGERRGGDVSSRSIFEDVDA